MQRARGRVQNRRAGRRARSAARRRRTFAGPLVAWRGSRIVELVGDNGGVADLSEVLAAAGVRPGDLVGLAVGADGELTVATGAAEWQPAADGWAGLAAEVSRADREVRPRWVLWSQETAQVLTGYGVRLATCWDVAAVHRLLFGGWRAEP